MGTAGIEKSYFIKAIQKKLNTINTNRSKASVKVIVPSV